MSSRIFVDALFVVALIIKREQYHQKASRLADSFENYPLLVTDIILLEIANSLSRNFKKEAIKIIEHFKNSKEVKVVHLSPKLFNEAYSG